nr:hypothetical protein [Anaerolineae bacterium]
MDSPFLPMLIPIGAVVIASLLIIGLYLWWRSFSQGDDAALPKPDRASQPQKRNAQPVPAAPPGSQAVEVMRVYRDLADGRLMVEVGGKRYRTLQEVPDPEIARQIQGNAQGLLAFAGTDMGDVQPPDPYMPEPVFPLVDNRSSSWPAPPAQEQPAPQQSAPKARGILGRRVAQQEEIVIPPPPTIAEQIEDLLQERLAENAEFEGRSIHIRPAPSGIGIIVDVDGNLVESVNDVADERVREFIQCTIRQWEEKQ